MEDTENSSKNDTLTFVNEEMTYGEVKTIFGSFGEIKCLSKFRNRYFVQFESPEEAQTALSELRTDYGVSFAHEKSKPKIKKNFRGEGERVRFWDPADLPIIGHSGSGDSSSGLAMIEEYLKSSVRNTKVQMEMKKSVENRLELFKTYENLRENIKGYESRQEYDKDIERRKEKAKAAEVARKTSGDSESKSRKNPKKDQAEKSADPKSNTPSVRDSQDAGSRDNSQEGKAEGVVNGETKENGGDEAGAGRRRIRIEGLEDVMNELGNDLSHSVIMANIPKKYGLDEVYDLVEEVKPIAFSEMNYSSQMRVKFCEIFVNDDADVKYLKQKLNDFVICGKQLTVMEPAEILDETRWNA